jgi:hypothetical protein
VAEANSLNDGLGEKSGNPIDLSSDDSAARVHVAHDEEIKPTRRSLPKATEKLTQNSKRPVQIICSESLYLLLNPGGRGLIITCGGGMIGVDHHGTPTPAAKQQDGYVW